MLLGVPGGGCSSGTQGEAAPHSRPLPLRSSACGQRQRTAPHACTCLPVGVTAAAPPALHLDRACRALPCPPAHPLIRQRDAQRRAQPGLHRHRHRQAALRPRRQPLVRRPQAAQQRGVGVLPHQVACAHGRQVHLPPPKGQRHGGACSADVARAGTAQRDCEVPRLRGAPAAQRVTGMPRFPAAVQAALATAPAPNRGGTHPLRRPAGRHPWHPGYRTRSRPPRAAAGRPGRTPGCDARG